MKQKNHLLTLPVFFSILFIYLEVFFHIFMFRSVDMNLLYILLFSVMGGCLLGVILSLFREKISFILSLACTIIICFFFCVEIVYQAVFQKFLAFFSMLGVAGQAFDFIDVIVKNILGNIVGTAQDFSNEYGVICVLKDAASIVTEPQTGRVYINNSGCGAMSKAGCGDVLTGVIAAMLALRLEPFSAAAMGVYIHGLAGEKATVGINEHSLMASDLIYFLLN
jgi:hypothetical protein